jgi:hypothetical protein
LWITRTENLQWMIALFFVDVALKTHFENNKVV